MALTTSFREMDGRRIETAHVLGHQIEVVAGYDITVDKYRFHVYVTDPAGTRSKLEVGQPLASSMRNAIEIGLAIAEASITPEPEGPPALVRH